MAFKIRLSIILIMLLAAVAYISTSRFAGRLRYGAVNKHLSHLSEKETRHLISVVVDTSQLPASSTVNILNLEVLARGIPPLGNSILNSYNTGTITIHGRKMTTVLTEYCGPVREITAWVKFSNSQPQFVNSDSLEIPDADVHVVLIIRDYKMATFKLWKFHRTRKGGLVNPIRRLSTTDR